MNVKHQYFDSPVHKIGIQATENIKKGEVIAYEPVYCFEASNENTRTTFKNYLWNGTQFNWGLKGHKFLVSGIGSFANHSDDPNINMSLSQSEKKNTYAKVFAIREIKKGEELFFNYGDNWWKKRPKIAKASDKPKKRGRPKGSKNKPKK
tara:strand:- start:457 stop:906 length:450 start_codon:yes stop_codon:yes gene_type:complete